jgi:hypothetical protein
MRRNHGGTEQTEDARRSSESPSVKPSVSSVSPWFLFMSSRAALAPCLVALALAACRSGEPAPTGPAASATATVAAPASASSVAAAPRPPASVDPLDEKLRHCPVTVDGARTEIVDADGGVDLVVTAAADAAVAEIRRRAKHLEEFTSDKETGVAHGGGAGGGWMRNCPVVTRDTRITSADVPGGSRLAVRRSGRLTVDELRAETRKRHAALSAPPDASAK